MSSIIAFCVACALIGVAFVAGVNWERGRPPTPAEMQEQVARHVEPQRTQETGALVITEQDRQTAERILREALG